MLATIAQYREAQEAYLARGALEAAGIEAVIADEQVVGINWLYSNAVGGVKLAVDRESSEQALEVLRAPTVDAGSEKTSPRPIRLHQIVGVLTILLLAAWVVPMIVVVLPIFAMSKRRRAG